MIFYINLTVLILKINNCIKLNAINMLISIFNLR